MCAHLELIFSRSCFCADCAYHVKTTQWLAFEFAGTADQKNYHDLLYHFFFCFAIEIFVQESKRALRVNRRSKMKQQQVMVSCTSESRAVETYIAAAVSGTTHVGQTTRSSKATKLDDAR